MLWGCAARLLRLTFASSHARATGTLPADILHLTALSIPEGKRDARLLDYPWSVQNGGVEMDLDLSQAVGEQVAEGSHIGLSTHGFRIQSVRSGHDKYGQAYAGRALTVHSISSWQISRIPEDLPPDVRLTPSLYANVEGSVPVSYTHLTLPTKA